jgi:hypothetical protein
MKRQFTDKAWSSMSFPPVSASALGHAKFHSDLVRTIFTGRGVCISWPTPLDSDVGKHQHKKART